MATKIQTVIAEVKEAVRIFAFETRGNVAIDGKSYLWERTEATVAVFLRGKLIVKVYV